MIENPLQEDQQQFPEESYFAKHNKVRIFVFELGSTAFLTFMAFCTVFVPPLIRQSQERQFNMFHHTCVAIIIYAIICFTAPFTGAHLNPAVTFAYFKHKKKQPHDLQYCCSYVLGQLLGSYIGLILSKSIYDCGFPVYQTVPSTFLVVQDFLGEALATFMLVLFILIATNQKTTFVYQQAWVHLYIAIAFFFSLTFSQKIGSMNPAIIFAMQTTAMFYNQKIQAISLVSVGALMIAEILGGILAEIFFRKLYLKTIVEWRDQI